MQQESIRPDPGSDRLWRAACIAVLVLAAALRVPHLARDLPQIYEEATPMRIAWRMWGGGRLDLNPHFFHYPTLASYIQLLAQAAWYAAGTLAGRFHGPAAFRQAFEADPTSVVLLARSIHVLFGLGSVALLLVLGARLAGRRAGLLAGALLAVAPTAVLASRMVVVDAPLLFFSLAALVAMSPAGPRPDAGSRAGRGIRSALASGVCVGLAASAKYTGALLVVPLVVWLAGEGIRSRRLWIALGAAAAAFLVTSPFCLLDLRGFLADFGYERTHMAAGHFGESPGNPLRFYAGLLVREFGVWVVALGLVGMIFQAARLRREPGWIPLLGFTVLYLAVLATWRKHAAFYLLPALPGCLLLAVRAAQLGWERVLHLTAGARRGGPASRVPLTAVAAALALLLIAPAAWRSGHTVTFDSRPNTLTASRDWILQNVPQGALIAMEYGTPELPFPAVEIPMNPISPETSAPYYDLGWFESFDYLVTSSGVAGRYRAEPLRFQRQVAFYDSLASRWTEAAVFGGAGYRGPEVRVFRNPAGGGTARVSALPAAGPAQVPALRAGLLQTLAGGYPPFQRRFLVQLADAFRDRGWTAAAAEVDLAITRFAPDYANAWYNLGTHLSESGRAEEAVETLREAVRLDSTRADFHNNLGVAYARLGRADEAAACFRRALVLRPAYPSARRNLDSVTGGGTKD